MKNAKSTPPKTAKHPLQKVRDDLCRALNEAIAADEDFTKAEAELSRLRGLLDDPALKSEPLKYLKMQGVAEELAEKLQKTLPDECDEAEGQLRAAVDASTAPVITYCKSEARRITIEVAGLIEKYCRKASEAKAFAEQLPVLQRLHRLPDAFTYGLIGEPIPRALDAFNYVEALIAGKP
jgi:hypothetical protein